MNNANKIRNAFNFIIKHGFCEGCCHKFDGNACHKYDCYENGVKVIREALKKQIPIKPNDKFNVPDYVLSYGICPSCNRGVNSDMKFCSECGQAIDWGEDE